MTEIEADESFSERPIKSGIFVLCFIPPLFGLLFMAIFVAGLACSVFFDDDTAFSSEMMLTVITLVVLVMVAGLMLAAKRFRPAAALGLSALAIMAAYIIFAPLRPVIMEALENVQAQHFLRDSRATCLAQVRELGPGHTIMICKEIDSNNSVYFRGLIYDSDDQLTKLKKDRSASWMAAAKQVLPVDPQGEVGDVSWPVFTARPLGDHFYYMKLDLGSCETRHF